LTFHESLDLIATTVQPLSPGGLGGLAPSIDVVVLLPEGLELRTEFVVADGSR
jgi:hypothetical protein